MMIASVLAAALLSAAADPPAAPAAPAAGSSTAVVLSPNNNPANQMTAPGDANKVVCKTEQTTGSRLGNVRVCMTNAQWMQKSLDDQRALGDSQIRSYGYPHED